MLKIRLCWLRIFFGAIGSRLERGGIKENKERGAETNIEKSDLKKD
jgi:hypothetical protein